MPIKFTTATVSTIIICLVVAHRYHQDPESSLEKTTAVSLPLSKTLEHETNDNEEHKRVLEEAALKRFPQVSVSQQGLERKIDTEVADTARQHIMLAVLVREALESDPTIEDEAIERALNDQPRIIELVQEDVEGQIFRQRFLIATTKNCDFKETSPSHHSVSFRRLTRQFCMDPLIDYPGGFDIDKPFQVKVSDFSPFNLTGSVSEQWSLTVQRHLRSIVKQRFTKDYLTTGQLTLLSKAP